MCFGRLFRRSYTQAVLEVQQKASTLRHSPEYELGKAEPRLSKLPPNVLNKIAELLKGLSKSPPLINTFIRISKNISKV